MCAEMIPLNVTVCEYCGARFEVTITGYCTNCHQVRDADEQGCCRTCNNEIIDQHIESRWIEESEEQLPQPVSPAPSLPASRVPNKRIWMWGIGSVIMLVLVALGFGLGPKLAPLLAPDTATPTLTATLVPSATPIPTLTRTPYPTPTITPMPDWFIAFNKFAEPILESIKDTPPDYQDDFMHAQGWQFHRSWEAESGSMEARDGALQMSITSKTAKSVFGFVINSDLRYDDFVLQVDADLSQLAQSDALEINWRCGSDGIGLVLSLNKDGHWDVDGSGNFPKLMSGNARINSAVPIPITIISKDTQYVILLDNVPVGYVNDPDPGRRPGRRIQLGFWVDAGGHTSLVKYSNLKVWDISKLSLP